MAAQAKARGNAALAAGKFDEAIAAYSEVGSIPVVSAWPLRGRRDSRRAPHQARLAATCRHNRRHHPRRRNRAAPRHCPVLAQAIAIDPKDHVFFSNRSAAHLSKGDARAALADAEECIKLAPSFVKGYGRQGAALYALRRLDDAEEAYDAGLQVDPNNAALKEGLADVQAALDREAARGM